MARTVSTAYGGISGTLTTVSGNITTADGTAGAIEGYADQPSVLPGQSFRLYVSTPAASFRVDAFRFGWYQGHQARHHHVDARDRHPGQRTPAHSSLRRAESRRLRAVAAHGVHDGVRVEVGDQVVGAEEPRLIDALPQQAILDHGETMALRKWEGELVGGEYLHEVRLRALDKGGRRRG